MKYIHYTALIAVLCLATRACPATGSRKKPRPFSQAAASKRRSDGQLKIVAQPWINRRAPDVDRSASGTRRILSIGTGWQYLAHCCGGLPDR